MGRTRCIVAAMIYCVCHTIPGGAQTSPPDGWVVLPVDEYQALRNRSLGIEPAPPGSPVEATLTRIDYDLRAEGDSIVGRALLTVDVLRAGWARVPIPSGLMVRDARVDGRPVPLVEDAAPHLLLSRSGRSVVELDVVVPLVAAAGTETIALPASAASITRAGLVLPRGGVELSLSGGFVLDRSETADESRWTVFGRPNQTLAFSWKRRVDNPRATLPLRFRARMTEFAGLSEDAIHVSASVRIEVLQGVAQEITLALPRGLVVNEVNGATVGDWQVADDVARVRLLDPVTSEVSFVLQGEMRAARDGAIAVPIVRVPAAERESGGIGVDVLGAGEIAERQARGLDAADPSELGDVVAGRESPSMLAFKLRPMAGTEARALQVTVVRYTPQAVLVANVEEARYRALAVEDGRLLVEARYVIRNNQRSFVKVSLPPGATIWTAQVAGRPIRPGVAEAGAVLLPLDKGRGGQDAPTFLVEMVYFQRTAAWPDKGMAAVTLAAVDLPTSRTHLTIHYPPTFTIEPHPGRFRIATSESAMAAPSVNRLSQTAPSPPSAAEEGSSGLQLMADRFRNEAGERTVVGALPVEVSFPAFGPSMFLAAELTAEGRAPSVELAVRRLRE
jgi:hypothetical protein